MNNKLNYPTWLVPLDIAKELKEIGFDEPCLFSYSESDGITAMVYSSLEGKIEISIKDFVLGGNSPGSPFTDIPTYEQVFAWFRERGYLYAIENEICYDFKTRTQPPKIKYTSYFETVGSGVKLHSCTSESYEEAREELVRDLIGIYREELLE
ncbi:hypothetical protein JMN10_12745 [Capnocytophaga genosp. AHN8471]|jgi:hypothetical protein|uniref:Uncharacterized protein n=1 Tax=Capnocytophaga genosp. AHN8471 TaxID=327574 RepID=A0ABS1YTU7_9FLAO|nr:hypothetical protein [Capnocytophaga genosp. AHN8471]MBM0649651.1 hypothetical protein [Capnocytophaga genosp. AHN8471]MBM0663038.1 hypothetical protein [Capnocytophaga genosp. AHN8471]